MPEHRLTHRCHIKTSSNERYTDTIQFSHKKITRPTITHADKVMVEIEDYSKAIKTLGIGNVSEKMKHFVQLTEKAIQHDTSIAATPPTISSDPEIWRVPLNNNNNNKTPQTRSMTQPNQMFFTVFTPIVPRAEQSTAAKQKTEKRSIHPKRNLR